MTLAGVASADPPPVPETRNDDARSRSRVRSGRSRRRPADRIAAPARSSASLTVVR